MTRGIWGDSVVIDRDALRAALDGRTQAWLARRAGISQARVSDMLRPGTRSKPYFARRSTYERMRAALPALPPPPEPTNGHAPAIDAGEGGA